MEPKGKKLILPCPEILSDLFWITNFNKFHGHRIENSNW